MKSKIFIADDHYIVIEGIKNLFRDYSEFEIIGETSNGREAVEQAISLKPNIVIMAMTMPQLSGLEATRLIKKAVPEIKIIIYSISRLREDVIELLKSGISAYVFGEDPPSELIKATIAVLDGGIYLSTSIPSIMQGYLKDIEKRNEKESVLKDLSLRERELFYLLVKGESVKKIGDILHISTKTVQTHKYNIMEKIKVQNMAELVIFAVKNQLIKV